MLWFFLSESYSTIYFSLQTCELTGFIERRSLTGVSCLWCSTYSFEKIACKVSALLTLIFSTYFWYKQVRKREKKWSAIFIIKNSVNILIGMSKYWTIIYMLDAKVWGFISLWKCQIGQAWESKLIYKITMNFLLEYQHTLIFVSLIIVII